MKTVEKGLAACHRRFSASKHNQCRLSTVLSILYLVSLLVHSHHRTSNQDQDEEAAWRRSLQRGTHLDRGHPRHGVSKKALTTRAWPTHKSSWAPKQPKPKTNQNKQTEITLA